MVRCFHYYISSSCFSAYWHKIYSKTTPHCWECPGLKTILFLFLRKDVARCMWCDEFASDKKVDADSNFD